MEQTLSFPHPLPNQEAGALIKEFTDTVLDLYAGLKEQPVCRTADQNVLTRLKQTGIPRTGRPLEEVYRQMLADVYPYQSLVQHPRNFACIPSPVSLVSWMGDVMTNAFDPHAGCWTNASAASFLEQELIRWMCGLAGYPDTSGGLFVSGGSMANLTALTAARDSRLTWEQRPLAVAYVSDQTHSSVAKGLKILGFRPDQVRKVPTDSEFSMDVQALSAAIQEDKSQGRIPFAVIATAGTTNTGSIDPLPEIARLCRLHQLWMHVDGAFGASILLSEAGRKRLSGIEQSDSISWDAHKWLMQTYGCSMVLVRDKRLLADSFCAHPEYLADAGASEAAPNFWDFGPELTRPARHLKLWMTLQTMGTDAMGQMIDCGCALAEQAEDLVRRLPDWEIASSAKQGIVNFRYAPAGYRPQELDAINQELARALSDTGYAQVFTTELRGRKVLRMCTLNPHTSSEDIRAVIDFLQRLLPDAVRSRKDRKVS